MGTQPNTHTVLNEVQMSLLRLFSRPKNAEETLRLKRLLVDYYAHDLEIEALRSVQEKGYSEQDIADMLNDKS